jgi:hypothetical protein
MFFLLDQKEPKNQGHTEICSIKPDGSDLQIIASHNYEGEYLVEAYYEAQWSSA